VRTTEISVSGMAHAWPAGPGGQNVSYVDNTRINYPVYVTNFWFNNNLRLVNKRILLELILLVLMVLVLLSNL